MNEKGERQITSRKCMVYGAGLSRKLLLVLARQHNEFDQVQRETTFPEVAASCRQLLYCHFAEEEESTDDGQYKKDRLALGTRLVSHSYSCVYVWVRDMKSGATEDEAPRACAISSPDTK